MLRLLCGGCYVEVGMLRCLCGGWYVEVGMWRLVCGGWYVEVVMLRWLCGGLYVEVGFCLSRTAIPVKSVAFAQVKQQFLRRGPGVQTEQR